MVGVGTRDYARAERAHERELERRVKDVDVRVGIRRGDPGWQEPPTRGRIYEWSAKSRARMVKVLCSLDYAPMVEQHEAGRIPAMVTLTVPGDWLAVVPTFEHFKAAVEVFKTRYRRSWGERIVGPWKLEFQRRGAPHLHVWMCPPHGEAGRRYAHGGLSFPKWLSATWSDCIDAQDPLERANHLLAGTGVDYTEGLRATDPKRAAVYFVKHGALTGKEYQHRVPDEWLEAGGSGRFWGYWGLEKGLATVHVSDRDALAAARILRRHSRAQRRRIALRRPRGWVQSKYPEVIGLAGAYVVEACERRRRRRRPTHTRAVQVRRGRGWASVNDGPAMAAALARQLEQLRVPPTAAEALEGWRTMRQLAAADLERNRVAGAAHVHGGRCCPG
jgi:hypothetical protein